MYGCPETFIIRAQKMPELLGELKQLNIIISHMALRNRAQMEKLLSFKTE